jgi:hypothetical protein
MGGTTRRMLVRRRLVSLVVIGRRLSCLVHHAERLGSRPKGLAGLAFTSDVDMDRGALRLVYKSAVLRLNRLPANGARD